MSNPAIRSRARLAPTSPHPLFACLLASALLALPSPALADASRESPGGGPDAEAPTQVAPAPVAPRYKPHLIGFSRYLRGTSAARKSAPVTPGQVECPTCEPLAPYERRRFHEPLEAENPWMPLVPGKQLVLQGVANRGGGLLDHQVIFTVTDLVKVIDGIPCIVVWDQDINQGVLSESELAFFAYSDDGAVYNSGEYPEEYENGEFVSAENTWIHGIETARAGVHVQRRPVIGVGYEQAKAPENDFWDCGRAESIERHKPKLCTPAGCFKDILTVHEWAPLDGCNVIQVKTYAKGVGIIQVGAIDDPEGETLVLQEINWLDDDEMDEARHSALALDTHGYEVNEHYALTEPAHLPRRCHRDDDDEDDDLRAGGPEALASAAVRTHLTIAVNPFSIGNPITYGTAEDGPVELVIFDVLGRKVRSLVDRNEAAGDHRVQWDGRDTAGNNTARGVYFARLRTRSQVIQKTIVLAD